MDQKLLGHVMGDRRGGFRGRGGGGGRGGYRGGDNNDFSQDNSGQNSAAAAAASANIPEEARDLFHNYQKELDEHYDRFERITKIKRDITIESKRIIFLLHRITTAQDVEQRDDIFKEAERRLLTLRSHGFQAIATELKGIDQNKYNWAVSGGLQEFIEAYSFYIYLREQRLSTFGEIQVLLAYPEPGDVEKNLNERLFLLVTLSDYVCGIGDLGGELMRLAMNQISAGHLDEPPKIVEFMRAFYRGFVLLGNTVHSKDFTVKTRVLLESIVKVESAIYMLNVRRSEVPEHMLADFVNIQCRNIQNFVSENTAPIVEYDDEYRQRAEF